MLIQLTNASLSPAIPKKFFLLIGTTKSDNRHLRTVASKPPGSWDGQGIVARLCRKHLKGSLIGIHGDIKRHHIWLEIASPVGTCFLHVSQHGPVEIELILPTKESILRFGSRGIFTKKKSCDLSGIEHATEDLRDETLECLQLQGINPDKSKEQLAKLELSTEQRELRRRLVRKKRTVQASYNKLKHKLPSKEEIVRTERYARLLQSYAYMAQDYTDVLILRETDTGTATTDIPLNPDLTVGQNIEDLFNRCKKAKRAIQLQGERLNIAEKELNELELLCDDLKKTAYPFEKLEEIAKRYRLSPTQSFRPNKVGALAYRVARSSEGFTILIGKGSKENDILTKGAKANDYWFHAVNVSGSHVIVPFRDIRGQGLSPTLRREAGILALHFSKLRDSYSGEVYVTQKMHLKKIKGSPPGLWKLNASESFHISYDSNEIKTILQRIE